MYSQYFGLSEPPFSIAPDPRFLYMSEQHREALAHLLYGIGSNGGFVLLTGEVGTGKTTVTRCLLEQLPESTDVAYILNPKYTVEELLATICDELSIPVDGESLGFKEYVDRINAHLIESHRCNRSTVLIIDEAQNLSVDVLEAIRLLTNLETNTQKLLQIILVGQPELSELLEQQALRQLNQRITARYHLRALKPNEIQDYLNHRLAVAGVDCPLFQPKSIKRLYKLTRGIPRLINIICDRALLGAYVQRETTVKAQVLGRAAGEVLGKSSTEESGLSGGLPALAAASSLVLVLIVLGYMFTPSELKAWVSSPEEVLIVQPESMAVEFTNNEEDKPANVEKTEQPEKNDVAAAVDDITPIELLEPDRETSIANENLDEKEIKLSNPAEWRWESKLEAQLSEALAYQHLFSLWGVKYQPKDDPAVCLFAESQGLSCYFQVRSLSELSALNHPAVLKLLNALGEPFFVTLVHIGDDYADLYIAEEQRRVALKDLDLWFSGNATLLWRKPKGYSQPLLPGSEGEPIAWLDLKLAEVQGRSPIVPTPDTYDAALVWQVKRFQHTFGLIADGVVGPKTAMQLASVTSSAIPKLRE